MQTYIFYIFSNYHRTVLSTGVTTNVQRKIRDFAREEDSDSDFGRYNNFYLVYYEAFGNIREALDRNEEVKSITRAEQDAIILGANPGWKSLNNVFWGEDY